MRMGNAYMPSSPVTRTCPASAQHGDTRMERDNPNRSGVYVYNGFIAISYNLQLCRKSNYVRF